jgi:hypothetical protein
VADRLAQEARLRNLDPAQYARQLLVQALPSAEPARSLRETFARWDAEDRTDDPTELQRRQEEWEQFRQAMNQHHSSRRKIYV